MRDIIRDTQRDNIRDRCEVSTEAPMFSTESKYGDLLVIVLPKQPPKVNYQPELNCTPLIWKLSPESPISSEFLPNLSAADLKS